MRIGSQDVGIRLLVADIEDSNYGILNKFDKFDGNHVGACRTIRSQGIEFKVCRTSERENSLRLNIVPSVSESAETATVFTSP